MRSSQAFYLATLANTLAKSGGAIDPEVIPPNSNAYAKELSRAVRVGGSRLGGTTFNGSTNDSTAKAEALMKKLMSPARALGDTASFGALGSLLGAIKAPRGHAGEGALRGAGAGAGTAVGGVAGSRLGMLLSKLLPSTEAGMVGRLMLPGAASIPGMFAGYAGANKVMGKPSWDTPTKSAAFMTSLGSQGAKDIERVNSGIVGPQVQPKPLTLQPIPKPLTHAGMPNVGAPSNASMPPPYTTQGGRQIPGVKGAALMPDMYKSAGLGALAMGAGKMLGGKLLNTGGKLLGGAGKWLAGEGGSMLGNAAAARTGRGAVVGGLTGGLLGPNEGNSWASTARNIGLGAVTGGALNRFGGKAVGNFLSNAGGNLTRQPLLAAANAGNEFASSVSGMSGSPGIAHRLMTSGANQMRGVNEAAQGMKGWRGSLVRSMTPDMINRTTSGASNAVSHTMGPKSMPWLAGGAAVDAFGLPRVAGSASDETQAQIAEQYHRMPVLQRLMMGLNPDAMIEGLSPGARQRYTQIHQS